MIPIQNKVIFCCANVLLILLCTLSASFYDVFNLVYDPLALSISTIHAQQ